MHWFAFGLRNQTSHYPGYRGIYIRNTHIYIYIYIYNGHVIDKKVNKRLVLKLVRTSWCHQMETFSASLALCVTGEFPSQRPVTRSFDVFFDLCLNKRLSKQPWGWWFETPHYDVILMSYYRHNTTRFTLPGSQHWFRWWLGAIKQQAITRANVTLSIVPTHIVAVDEFIIGKSLLLLLNSDSVRHCCSFYQHGLT